MRIAWISICGVGVALTLACGVPASAPPAGAPAGPAEDPCFLSGAATSASTISVVLLETVQPERAPVPRTSSERLLFRHLYEGLTAVACDGSIGSALAADWELIDAGRTWLFHLRGGARFWDGSAVTARDVVRAWARGPGADRLVVLDAGPVRVEALTDRTVRVVTARPKPRLPWLLASPELAVVKRGRPGGWPVGTGPFRLVGRAESRGELAGTWVTESFSPRTPPGLAVEFRAAAGMDPRDVMEMLPGADVLLTADPRAVDFAQARPGFRAEPLPWDRIYVLTVSRRASASGTPGIQTAALASEDDLMGSLARDAVRRVARAAQAPYWWNRRGDCEPGAPSRFDQDPVDPTGGAGAPGGASAQGVARLVYPAGDETAADLAERLVALIDSPRRPAAADRLAELIWGSASARPQLAAAALPPHEFIAAVRTGSEAAYVLALPKTVLDACQTMADLISADGILPGLAGLDGQRVRLLLPLVETREHVLLGAGAPSMGVDWDAVPVIGRRGAGRGARIR